MRHFAGDRLTLLKDLANVGAVSLFSQAAVHNNVTDAAAGPLHRKWGQYTSLVYVTLVAQKNGDTQGFKIVLQLEDFRAKEFMACQFNNLFM